MLVDGWIHRLSQPLVFEWTGQHAVSPLKLVGAFLTLVNPFMAIARSVARNTTQQSLQDRLICDRPCFSCSSYVRTVGTSRGSVSKRSSLADQGSQLLIKNTWAPANSITELER